MAIDITAIGIGVDTAPLKTGGRDLDNLGKSADEASRKADKLGVSISKMAKLAIAGFAGISALRLINEMTMLATRYNELGIVMNTVGRNAGYTSAQLNEQEMALRKTGISMIESRANMAKLISANIDLANATKLARLAQDAAVIGGTNSSEAFARLVNGIQTAQVETLRTLGLNVNFENSYKQLASQLGKTTLELTEYEKTQARVNAVMKIAPTLAGAYEASMDNAGKQLRSSTRYVEDFKVKLGETFNEALTVSVLAFTEGIKSANGELDEMVADKQLKEWGENITDTMAFVADSVMGVSATFRLAGSHMAEFFALRSSLSGIFGGTDNKNIRAAAEADRQEIMATASMFRRALEERRKALDEREKKKDPELERLMAEDAEFEMYKRRSEEAAIVRQNKAREDAIKANKKLSEERLRDLQKEIDFEEDMREMRDKAEVELFEKQRKIQLDWYEDQNKRIVKDIETRAKIEQDYFKRTNDAIVRGLEERGREAKRIAKSIEQSLTDALMRGFESGKGFAQNFIETLKNMFQTLVLRPVISAVVSPVAAGITGAMGLGASGTAMAGTGGAGGIGSIFSMGKSLLNGISGVQGAVTSGIESLGSMIAGNGTGMMGNFGGWIGANAGTIGNILPFAGAAFQALTGDIKGAAFTAAGAAIGSIIPGVGTVIGGAIGGLVGGLFGGSGEKYKQVIQQRTGSLVGGEFSTRQGQSKRATPGLASGLDALNETFARNLSSILTEFGLNGNVGASSSVRLRRTSGRTAGIFGSAFDGRRMDMTGEFAGDGDIGKGFQQFAAKVLGQGLVTAIRKSSLPEGIKKFFDGLTKQEDVAGAINAVVGLNRALGELPAVFDAIDFALFTTEFKMTVAQLTQDFSAVQKYTELFYTEQENFDTFTRQLQAQFEELNVVMPTTKDAFRALVDGIEVTSEATYNQLQALIRLAPAADAYYKSIEAQRAALYNLSAEMFATQFEFNRAQIYEKSGIPLSMLPSYDVGTSYVPQTGPAMIHQGERILTASENKDFGNVGMEIRNLGGDLRNMRSELQSIAISNAKLQKSVDRLEKDGFIIRDVDAEGNAQVLQVEVVS